jgi:hypothetical protein
MEFINKNNVRGINNSKKGYKRRSNLERGEKGHLLADSLSILITRKNGLSQLMNVHGVSDFRQMQIHISETLVSHSDFKSALLLENVKCINLQVFMKFRQN